MSTKNAKKQKVSSSTYKDAELEHCSVCNQTHLMTLHGEHELCYKCKAPSDEYFPDGDGSKPLGWSESKCDDCGRILYECKVCSGRTLLDEILQIIDSKRKGLTDQARLRMIWETITTKRAN